MTDTTDDFIIETDLLSFDDYMENHKETIIGKIDRDMYDKVLKVRGIPQGFNHAISKIHKRYENGKSWITEDLIMHYGLSELSRMITARWSNDNYVNIIKHIAEAERRVPSITKGKARLLSVVGDKEHNFHTCNVTHGLCLSLSDILGTTMEAVSLMALLLTFNSSKWTNHNFDWIALEYTYDLDIRLDAAIKNRMDARLDEIYQARDIVSGRYSSFARKYISGKDIDPVLVERMKRDIKWLRMLKKDKFYDDDVDDFNTLIRKCELSKADYNEIESHKLITGEKHESETKSRNKQHTDEINTLKKEHNNETELLKKQHSDEVNKITDLVKSLEQHYKQMIKELSESHVQTVKGLHDSYDIKLTEQVEALRDSYDVKLSEQYEATKRENIILKNSISDIDEKLELLSESSFNKIKKLMFK